MNNFDQEESLNKKKRKQYVGVCVWVEGVSRKKMLSVKIVISQSISGDLETIYRTVYIV